MRVRHLLTLIAAMSLAACDGNKTDNRNAGDKGSGDANRNSEITAVVSPPAAPAPSSPVDPNYKSCNPYLPLMPGSVAKYRIFYANPLEADVTVVVDSGQENGHKVFTQTEQIVDASGGSRKLSNSKKTYVCEGANVCILRETADNRVEQYQNKVEMKFSEHAYAMIAPSDIKPGRTWSYDLTTTLQVAGSPPTELDPVTRYAEYGGEEVVSVLAGKFKTIKITWKFKDKKGAEYYARGIGLVKRVADDGTRWELKEYNGLNYQE